MTHYFFKYDAGVAKTTTTMSNQICFQTEYPTRFFLVPVQTKYKENLYIKVYIYIYIFFKVYIYLYIKGS